MSQICDTIHHSFCWHFRCLEKWKPGKLSRKNTTEFPLNKCTSGKKCEKHFFFSNGYWIYGLLSTKKAFSKDYYTGTISCKMGTWFLRPSCRKCLYFKFLGHGFLSNVHRQRILSENIFFSMWRHSHLDSFSLLSNTSLVSQQSWWDTPVKCCEDLIMWLWPRSRDLLAPMPRGSKPFEMNWPHIGPSWFHCVDWEQQSSRQDAMQPVWTWR